MPTLVSSELGWVFAGVPLATYARAAEVPCGQHVPARNG